MSSPGLRMSKPSQTQLNTPNLPLVDQCKTPFLVRYFLFLKNVTAVRHFKTIRIEKINSNVFVTNHFKC